MPKTAAQLIEAAALRLSGLPDPGLDAELLFRGVSGLSRAGLLARSREPVEGGWESAFEAAVARRLRHEPVQYILGTAGFWRDEFVVNEAVLIPRPETEILVEAVATRLRASEQARLLDVGTGTGCVALSLLRELPHGRALCVDLSPAALAIAALNSKRLGFEQRAEFRASRWFATIDRDEVFDAIVSNPPYVARTDEPSLPRSVREFEPRMALFADEYDDLSSYRAIAAGFRPHLVQGGLLALEVGMGQAGQVAALLSASDLAHVEVIPDLAGIPRVVLGRKL